MAKAWLGRVVGQTRQGCPSREAGPRKLVVHMKRIVWGGDGPEWYNNTFWGVGRVFLKY